jgi:HPr kinase/phosphorylase
MPMARKSRPVARPKRASRRTAEEATLSGGLLCIVGVGTLIIGDSGIGKSESALELIARGHQFVSDDVVRVRRSTGGRIVGEAPVLTRNFMEIRGLGIINIREIFGARAIRRSSPLDLIIRLRKWKKGLELDRLGLKVPDDATVLGVRVPQLLIPVAPGRNIATLIEVACKVHLLRQKGYHAPREIVRRLDRALLT